MNTPTAINIGYATLLAGEGRFDEAWAVIDAAHSTIPQIDLVKVVIYAAASRWQDVIGLHPPPAEVLDHRLRMNTFLGKWLQYLAERGHGVGTLVRASGETAHAASV